MFENLEGFHSEYSQYIVNGSDLLSTESDSGVEGSGNVSGVSRASEHRPMDEGSGHTGGLLPNSLPGHASDQHYLPFGSRSRLIIGMLLSAIPDTWMLTSPFYLPSQRLKPIWQSQRRGAQTRITGKPKQWQ